MTARELKVLGKLQSGLSNKELADALFITEGTLKWHLRNIYSKLGVVSRLAAVSIARQNGLISESGAGAPSPDTRPKEGAPRPSFR